MLNYHYNGRRNAVETGFYSRHAEHKIGSGSTAGGKGTDLKPVIGRPAVWREILQNQF